MLCYMNIENFYSLGQIVYLIIILLPIFIVGNNVSFQKDLKNCCVYPQKAIYNKKYTKREHN